MRPYPRFHLNIAMPRLISRIFRFYYDGFRSMTVGRKLWLIILVKLVIIFAVLRAFFFTPALSGSDEEKADTVRRSLIVNDNNDIKNNP